MSTATATPEVRKAEPVIQTDTASAGIESIVNEIARLLVAEGTRIDPHLIVVERDGHLAIATQEGHEDLPFISLPIEVLVPVEDLTWDAESAQIELVGGADSLSSVQQDLLTLHIALWNATDKLATFRATHPRAAAMHHADLCDAITKIRPTFTPGDTTRDMLRTRTFSLRSGESSKSVVMPILELADHHPYGAPYALEGGRLSADYRFVDDTGLAYVHYGPRRDAIDLACLYGYATDFTTFFVSAPLCLELEGFGTLTIERSVNRRAPSTWQVVEGNLMVDYLLVDAYTGLFDAFHHPVRDYLLSRGASKSQALSLAIDAAETLLQANDQHLIEVIAVAETVPHNGASTVALAAAHQRTVIDVIGELA